MADYNEELNKLLELKEQGVISEEEFQAKKKELEEMFKSENVSDGNNDLNEQAQESTQKRNKFDIFAKIGSIFGLISLILCWVPYFGGGYFGIVGMVFGKLGEKSETRADMAKKGFTKGLIGTIISVIATIIWIIIYAVVFAVTVS